MSHADPDGLAAAGPAPGLRLPADLGIENVTVLRESLLARLDEPRALALEGQDVTRLHTASLQLLCIFCRDRRATGYETRWREPSETLRQAAALLGLGAILQLEVP